MTRQRVTQRQSEGSRRYLAAPASAESIQRLFVLQASHPICCGLLNGLAAEATRGGA